MHTAKSIKDTKATGNRDIYYKEPYARKHEMRNNHGIGFVLRWARAIQLSAHCMYGSRCSWQTSAKLTPQFPAPRKTHNCREGAPQRVGNHSSGGIMVTKQL